MPARRIKPVFDEKDFVNNPLIQADFSILVRRFKDGSWITNQSEDGKRIHRLKEVEAEQEPYAKLFIHKDKRLCVAGLAGMSAKVLLWIMSTLEPSTDYLWINVRRCMDENIITDIRTYQNAVAELCRYNFICPANPKYKNTYWINPRLFFNGSRINKYPEYVREGKEEKGKQDEVSPSVSEVIRSDYAVK